MSSDHAQAALLEKAMRNPTLYPGALTERERDASFKWHDHCGSPRSSQAFCLSAFGTLQSHRARDRVLECLFRSGLPGFPNRSRPRRWEINPEAEMPVLLGEFGSSQAISIDALCESSQEVVCIESKFATDAEHGFGGCSQFSGKQCEGYHGPGFGTRLGRQLVSGLRETALGLPVWRTGYAR